MYIMVRQGTQRIARHMLRVSAVGLSLALPVGLAQAQQPAGSATAQPQPSTNAMVNLINLLVKQGTLTQANGAALLAQAQAEAEQSRANITQAATNAGVPPPPEGTIRVPYVPETVRRQIAEQVRGEVMATAKSEGWAAPGNAAPDWTRRIKISGDVRVRSQSELYSRNNDNTVVDIAAINAAPGGFNFTGDASNLRFLNTRKDRLNRLKVRARIALDADISPAVKAGFRIATGDDNSPISTNQNLGGGLTKRDLWLDRAFVQVEPKDWMTIEAGRFGNPFRSTQLLFDDDLNFDGVTAEFRADRWLPQGFKLAVRGGAFPLDFGSANFPDTSRDKATYPSKWLFSGQIEGSYKTAGGIQIAASAGFHAFRNVQGRLSSPCLFNGVNIKLVSNENLPLNDPTECSTDGTRAFGARKGNTYFFIRQLAVPDLEPYTISPLNQREYLGLTYKYRVLDLNASVTAPLDDEISATLSGDYIRNLAFRRRDECRYGSGFGPVTNLAANGSGDACLATNPNPVISGNMGWMVDLAVGHAKPRRWGEWRVQGSYRYLQSDATLDSLTDSDFHLGGTNTKGFTVGGTLGLLDGMSLTGRWMSANEVTGSPLAIDVFQLDLTAEF